MKMLKYIMVKTLLIPHVQVPPCPEKSLRKFQFTAVTCSGHKVRKSQGSEPNIYKRDYRETSIKPL
jgi:hypothetical protein